MAASRKNDQLVKKLALTGADMNYSPANQSLLSLASKNNDLQAARFLLINGTDPNLISFRGTPVIYFFMELKLYDFVKLLDEFGADIFYRAPSRKSLFDLANLSKNLEMMDYLQKKGVRPYKSNQSDSKILQLLLSENANDRVDELENLLKSGENPYVLMNDEFGPLDIAAENKNLAAVTILLKAGVDPNYPYGKPLVAAVKSGDFAIVKELLDSGTDPNLRESYYGGTPLHFAVCENLPIVQLLVEHKAIINLERSHDRVTPFSLATFCPETGSAEYLSKIGGSVEPGDSWMDELNQFSLAAARGDVGALTEMIAAGHSVNEIDKFHNTALHYAARAGAIGAMETLLKHGATINFNGDAYYSPLMYAAFFGEVEGCKYLLKKGCNIHLEGSGEKNVLHLAAGSNSVELVRLFLENGMDINSGRGKFNGTPLHYAAYYDAVDTAEFLLENGADINALDKHQRTPLHEAVIYSKPNVTKLLLEHGANIEQLDYQGYSAKTTSYRDTMNGNKVHRLMKKYSGEEIQASFNCEEAKRIVDLMICGDSNLAALDAGLDIILMDRLKNASGGTAKEKKIRNEHEIWLESRNDKCGIRSEIFPMKKNFWNVNHCLEKVYNERTQEFLKVATTNESH